MQSDYSNFMESIIELFRPISNFFQDLGLPFGPIAWMIILMITPLLLIVILLVVRGRRGGSSIDEGIKKIIASTGDVSSGMAGVKKFKFLKTPAQALVFLKVEENAIQQALSAIDYYEQKDEIDEDLKTKFVQAYQDRLEAVRSAIDKDEAFKEIVDTSSAVDRARSDYLQKLAAMSGTAVETDDGEKAGPSSVGMPSSTETTTPTTVAPSETAPSGGAPSGGPPGGEAPSGGPPGGEAPSGGPPGGEAPSGGTPDGGVPSGGAPVGGPPGGSVPGGAPSEAAPKDTGGKSSLQSEMLQEMERLKALMGGD